MRLLVRSWNVFHGNACPPERRAFLCEMLKLAAADRPDVLCLQELPVWSLRRLEAWTGMQAFAAVARRPPLGAAVGRALTAPHHGLLRSAVSGQANAILLARALVGESLGSTQISGAGRERRVCHAVRAASGVVLGNLHASNAQGAPAVIADEIARALLWVDSLAVGSPAIVAGDFNLVGVAAPDWSPPGPTIDHVLVRGLPATAIEVWPDERRHVEGRILSDHAPVELIAG